MEKKILSFIAIVAGIVSFTLSYIGLPAGFAEPILGLGVACLGIAGLLK